MVVYWCHGQNPPHQLYSPKLCTLNSKLHFHQPLTDGSKSASNMALSFRNTRLNNPADYWTRFWTIKWTYGVKVSHSPNRDILVTIHLRYQVLVGGQVLPEKSTRWATITIILWEVPTPSLIIAHYYVYTSIYNLGGAAHVTDLNTG